MKRIRVQSTMAGGAWVYIFTLGVRGVDGRTIYDEARTKTIDGQPKIIMVYDADELSDSEVAKLLSVNLPVTYVFVEGEKDD